MANRNTKAAANDIQNLFDPSNYQTVFKTWATMNERMTNVAVEAGLRSTDIATETAKESFANLREASTVRDDVSEYGRAYSDLMQKQMDLFMRTAQHFATVAQEAGSETAEVTKGASEEMIEATAANAQGAADRASSATKKAA